MHICEFARIREIFTGNSLVYIYIYIYIHTFSLDSGEQATATCELCTPTVVYMYALGKTAVTKKRRLIWRSCVIRIGKRGGGGGSSVNI